MKKILISAFAVMITAAAYAQSDDPVWISKDVQKQQVKKSGWTTSEVRTSNVIPVSKGVAAIQQRETGPSVAVKKTGMPAEVIQKPVARMQYQKSNR